METDKLTLKGPYEIQLIAHVTNGEDEGKVTINLAMADVPTEAAVQQALEQAKGAVEGQGFRLMNKTEFFNVMMHERFGTTEKFAVPGGNNWDA
jgi:hypothetical protein